MLLISAWAVAALFIVLQSGAIAGFAMRAARWGGGTLSFAYGLGAYMGAVFALGLFKQYRPVPVAALMILAWVFLALDRRKLTSVLREALGALNFRLQWPWFILPILYMLCRLFAAGLPQQHNDALYYHMAAAKFWAGEGRILLTADHPSFAQATLWESLFGVPLLFLSRGEESILPELMAHISGQWMHALWGQAATVAALFVLLSRIGAKASVPLAPAPRLFAAWLLACLPSIQWTGALAKNDYVYFLFVVVGFAEAVAGRALATGLALGLAFATKPVAAWAGLGCLFFLAPRRWPALVIGGLAASALVLGRNFYFTRNPLFPGFEAQLGPGWVSDAWNAHNASFIGGPRWDAHMLLGWAPERLFEKPLPAVVLALGLAALAYQLLRTRKVPALTAKGLASCALQFIMALLLLRPNADARYAMPIIALAGAFLVPAVAQVFPSRPVLSAPLILLGLLINTPLDVLYKVPAHYLFKSAPLYLERFHPDFAVTEWLNKNVLASERVFFAAEKANYYFKGRYVTTLETRKWEDLLRPLGSLDEAHALLREHGYHYVHHMPGAPGFFVNPAYARDLARLLPKARIATPLSMVFRLEDLK